MAQYTQIWYVPSQLVLLDIRMHSFLCGLPWSGLEKVLHERHFLILQDFYQ